MKNMYVKVVTIMSCMVILSADAVETNTVPVELQSVARMDARTSNKTRDPGLFGDYWWANRFLSRHRLAEAFLSRSVDVVLIGDSITHFWEWHHPDSWRRFTAHRTALNLGYGGDRTQNVIWRLEHGELEGYRAKNIVLMIGTNNNSVKEADPAIVACAIKKIIGMIRERQPEARLILHPIFPRGVSADAPEHGAARLKNDMTNRILKEFVVADGKIAWVDFNDKLVDASGWVPKEMMADQIHPTEEGYEIWRKELDRVLR